MKGTGLRTDRCVHGILVQHSSVGEKQKVFKLFDLLWMTSRTDSQLTVAPRMSRCVRVSHEGPGSVGLPAVVELDL